MCFSAQADVVGGLVVTAIGVDVLAHVRGRRKHMALAALPMLLGVHQLVEAFVWWGLQGHVDAGVGRVATWIYLLIAFVVLPVFVPLAVMALEPDRRKRRFMLVFAVLGVAVAAVLLAAMARGPAKAVLGDNHLSYSTDLRAGLVIVVVYIVATCGSLIMSSYRDVAVFGIVNLVAVGVIAELTIDGFASLWCAWAAIASAAFAIHLRYGRGGTKRVLLQ